MINFSIDPITSLLLAWVLKKLFDHERLLAVLKNDCPKIDGARKEAC